MKSNHRIPLLLAGSLLSQPAFATIEQLNSYFGNMISSHICEYNFYSQTLRTHSFGSNNQTTTQKKDKSSKKNPPPEHLQISTLKLSAGKNYNTITIHLWSFNQKTRSETSFQTHNPLVPSEGFAKWVQSIDKNDKEAAERLTNFIYEKKGVIKFSFLTSAKHKTLKTNPTIEFIHDSQVIKSSQNIDLDQAIIEIKDALLLDDSENVPEDEKQEAA